MTQPGDEQLFFDFSFESESGAPSAPVPSVAPAVPDELVIRQAVLAHLVREGFAGAALKVPGVLRKFPADIAAFRPAPGGKTGEVTCCVMVDIRTDRADCLPECGGREEAARELADLRRRKLELEAEIRAAEPELRENDELFDEFQSFAYRDSANQDYHKLCRRLENLQQALFKGTRMERLSRAAAADLLYLAVPEGLIEPDELLDGWGLWYILPDRTLREVRPALPRDCGERERTLLVRNIAQAALNNVLFAQGVHGLKRGAETLYFTRPPRARRRRS